MLLTVKNLKVSFRQEGESEAVNAVDGLDFSIGENEVLGIVGESGSGKTVTALSVMRLLSESDSSVSGTILFEGRDILRLTEDEMRKVRGSKIGMVFQEPFTSLNPVLRIGEQIEEAILAHKSVPKKIAKKETVKLLEKVKIPDPERIYYAYPHLLSGGERQRVMIAMAISQNPRLLIADEPTTALDVTIQAEILELILALKRDLKMSVLFITHDFGIINRVADKVLVMKDGVAVEQGGKDEILSSPKEDYTKKLLEAVPRITARPEEKEEGKTIIAVKDLKKAFPLEKGIFKKKSHIAALNGVSLEIKEGKTLGLVGESGSGKSTLGKILIGLLGADSGRITGRECQKSTQIVFQDPYSSLDPRMRMRDIVLEGLTVRGAKGDQKEKVLKDVLFKVHLNYKDRLKYPHQFSGGQRQRIAIARALAVKPRIVILDEPVSSLDVIIQSGILNLLKDLQKELSLTYVFISHDLRVVEYMADEVAVMQKGEIVELASRNRIYASPKHPYTRRLLASALLL